MEGKVSVYHGITKKSETERKKKKKDFSGMDCQVESSAYTDLFSQIF